MDAICAVISLSHASQLLLATVMLLVLLLWTKFCL